MEKVMVSTPQGVKFHGWIDNERELFLREVTEGDRMKIYDAWSIHPDVFERIKNLNGLRYKDKDTGTIYNISIPNAIKHGFTKTHGGGKTFYIPIKYWETETNQGKLV